MLFRSPQNPKTPYLLRVNESKHGVLILETFKNQVSLFVFEFLNLVLCAHVVVLQLTCGRQFSVHLCVEHMRAKIKHSPLVDFIVFVLTCVLLAVPLHEKTDLVTKLAFLLANIRMVLLQIGQTNQ